MKKVLILFDTKRGSTEKIASRIKSKLEKQGIDTDVVRITDSTDITFKDYDLVIIGSPIYFEKPLKSVLKFTEKHSKELAFVPIAVFVVNMADIFGHLTESYIQTKYIGAITQLLKNPPVLTYSIRGWMRKPPRKTEKNVENFVKRIITLFKNHS